jgi:uracil-DNA glycosylase
MLLSPARRAQCPRGSALPDKLLFTLYISFNYLFYIILMDSYSSLFAALEQRPHSDTVCNPYRLPGRTHNLRAYFRAIDARPGRRLLVVGEALGYRGGLGTGIPLSSSALLTHSRQPFLRALRPSLQLHDEVAEVTATIVWDYLARRRTLPLFWNAFPFHPHREGEPQSNRAPTAAEMSEGIAYLQLIRDWYQPQRLAGLGRKGAQALKRAFPGASVITLRHPSYGGKNEFIRGMDGLLG